MRKSDAKQMAYDLMLQYGLLDDDGSVFGPNTWDVQMTTAKNRFGSGPLCELNDADEVADTILHEIAHALTPGSGHGSAWKLKCIEIGADPQRCKDGAVVKSPPYKYKVICPGCKRVAGYRRVNRKTKHRRGCGTCCNKYAGGKWDSRFEFQFVLNDDPVDEVEKESAA